MDFCGDHKEVSGCAKRIEMEVKTELWPEIRRIDNIQKTRDIVSKKDLLVFIYWLAPSITVIAALVFGIAVYLSTSRITFASREIVLDHEHRIIAIEKSLVESKAMFGQMMDYQKAILAELQRDK